MINFLSLFTGIGAFEKAMKNLDIPFNLVGFSDIDKYAIKSYCAMHGVSEDLNLGDITKIDEKALPQIDFITYGFPCQDISIAGGQKGLFNDDGTQTRSGLFFDALRIIEHTKPIVAVAENVKNLLSSKFNAQFQVILASLEYAGYNNYFAVLNAKDYGIPQNRERVFIVSIRKDVDTGAFEFPKGFELKIRLKDVLEDVVDEKFYLSKKMFNYAFNMIKEAKGIDFSDGVDSSFVNPQIAQTIGCRSASDQRSGTTNYVCDDFDEPLKVSDMKEMLKTDKVMQIGNCMPGKNRPNPNQGRVYDKEGIAPSLTTMGGGNREPMVIDKVNKVGNIYPSGGQNGNVYDIDGISPTLLSGETSTKGNGGIGSSNAPKVLIGDATIDNLRIRKLTPKECFRLMGFTDDDFAKAEAVNSNTQLYKQAGNSIVVNVAEALIKQIFRKGGEFDALYR